MYYTETEFPKEKVLSPPLESATTLGEPRKE